MINRVQWNKSFTLIELVCVLTIAGVLLGLAVPCFFRSLAWWELDAVTWQMSMDIKKWQQKALCEQKYGLKLVVNQSQRKYYLMEGAAVREMKDLSKNLSSLSVTPASFFTVEFFPSGSTSAAGTYALENRYGKYKYIVILNTTGRVRISTTRP